MTRKPCRWVRAQLPLLAGGDLIGPNRRHAERHLLTCNPCRALLQRHQNALHALHTFAASTPPPPAPALWPPLQRQIAESRRSPSPWPIPLTRRWLALAAAAAATLTLIAATAWQISQHYHLVVGLRPRIARLHPQPVFPSSRNQPTNPIASSTSSPSSPPSTQNHPPSLAPSSSQPPSRPSIPTQ
ncbi:MAG: hypothetical protein KatS3mg108_0280 [Isosphaeraceae bacterium]|jgi:anti-sigma factor RsiW|nr:MAG: hypothetical protein KatS3mg108_0280 [Isosphaeraceae bacterium]